MQKLKMIHIGIACSIFCFFIFLKIQLGYQMDFLSATTAITQYDRYLTIAILVSTVMSVILYFGNQKIVKLGYFGQVILLVGVIQLQPDVDAMNQAADNLGTLDWETFEEFEHSDSYYLVYVGREDCAACLTYKAQLKPISVESDISIWYYDITQERHSADFETKKTHLKLTDVPAIYIVGHNQVKKIETDVLLSADERAELIEKYDLA